MPVFPDTIKVTRPGVDTRPIDPDTGQPIGTAPAPVVVYDGRCRFAGMTRRAERVMRSREGDVAVAGGGEVRLPGDAGTFDQETDSAELTVTGVKRQARILAVDYRHRRRVLVVGWLNRGAST